MLFVNYLEDCVLVEETPQGEHSVPVWVDERAATTLSALLALESFEVAQALGSLYEAGKLGRGTTQPASLPGRRSPPGR